MTPPAPKVTPGVMSLDVSWQLPSGAYGAFLEYCRHTSGQWVARPNAYKGDSIPNLPPTAFDVRVVYLPDGGVSPVVTATPLASGVVVNATPSGPPTPPSGWTCVMADGFDANHPLSSLWGPNQDNDNGRGSGIIARGADKVEATAPSQVTLGADGLRLTAVYSPGVAQGINYDYLSGCVITQSEEMMDPEGGQQGFPITGFSFVPTPGVITCFEAVCAMPPINSPAGSPGDWGEDPGYWLSTSSWQNEIDLFEAWGYYPLGGWPSVGVGIWIYDPANGKSIGQNARLLAQSDQQPHRWTHVFDGNDRTLKVYLDKELQTYVGNNGVMQWPASFSRNPMYLILGHELRNAYGKRPTWKLGSTTFRYRSQAVYQDTAHARVGIGGGLIAPGTIVQ